MILEKYISALLYDHDCVVVPEFGAFIAQKTSSSFIQESSVFYPPGRQLAFNPSLTKNDGLLVQYIARTEGSSFEKAQEEVGSCVKFWKNHLEKNTSLNLDKLGSLSKDEKGFLVFKPSNENFFLGSFGLEKIRATYILPVETRKSSGTVWWKAATVVPILLGGYLYFGKPQPVSNFVNEQWSGFVSPILNPSAGADSASPSIIRAVEEKTADKYIVKDFTTYDYQVIVGSFRVKVEAETLEKNLQSRGFEFSKLTQKKGSYYYVALKTFPTKEQALEYRKSVQEEFPQTWVLSLKE